METDGSDGGIGPDGYQVLMEHPKITNNHRFSSI